MQPLSGNQRPDLLTSLTNMSLVLRLPRDMHLRRSSRLPTLLQLRQKVQNPFCACHTKRHLNVQKWSEMVRDSQFVTLLTSKCASRHNTFWTSQVPKVLRRWGVLHILTRKRASRHNGVHFSTSQLPRVPRRWNVFLDVFSILAWKCASRHNGVQIFISHLRPAALASLLFDPSEPQNIGKTQCFATFLPFRAPASSFFWLFLFSDLLSSSLLFSSLTLPTSAFSSVHIVRSLAPKLPSVKIC